MSLQDSYETYPDPQACLVCTWAATLPESDQDYLNNKARNPRTDVTRLFRAARDNGYDRGITTFRKHVSQCVREVNA